MVTRAAILGTGFWARDAHLPALRAIPGVVVTSCVGRTLERATSFCNETGIPAAYGSLDDLLSSVDRPDLLVVAGPDAVHVAATTAALEAGIPVFCEKPLANRAAEAHDLASLAERLGVPATVGYSFRYSPAIQAMHGDLESGALGDPWMVELFEYNAQFHPALGKPMNWKGDPAQAAAGALFEYGSHIVDIAGWLAGPVEAVSTNWTRVLPGARLDDIATLQLRLRPPAIGVLVSSWVLSGSMPGIKVRMHCSEGLAEAELSQTIPGGQAYRRYALDGSVRAEADLPELGDAYAGYCRRHLEDFLGHVHGEVTAWKGTLPSLADGARVQDVLETALQATARWVDVETRGANGDR
jgi:predicted dehydrogenase